MRLSPSRCTLLIIFPSCLSHRCYPRELARINCDYNGVSHAGSFHPSNEPIVSQKMDFYSTTDNGRSDFLLTMRKRKITRQSMFILCHSVVYCYSIIADIRYSRLCVLRNVSPLRVHNFPRSAKCLLRDPSIFQLLRSPISESYFGIFK